MRYSTYSTYSKDSGRVEVQRVGVHIAHIAHIAWSWSQTQGHLCGFAPRNAILTGRTYMYTL